MESNAPPPPPLPSPLVEAPAPDLDAPLLVQKLQMINCCIQVHDRQPPSLPCLVVSYCVFYTHNSLVHKAWIILAIAVPHVHSYIYQIYVYILNICLHIHINTYMHNNVCVYIYISVIFIHYLPPLLLQSKKLREATVRQFKESHPHATQRRASATASIHGVNSCKV